MAQGKKSFVAYADWKEVFDELPDAEAGQLIKHIFAYVNDENPVSDSVLIRAVFANIKTTLKRDLDKWESQLKQRSEAGKKSAEIRSTKSNERSTSVEIRQRNPTDSVSVSVNDNVSDNVNVIKEEKPKGVFPEDLEIVFSQFLEMRKKTKKNPTERAIELLREKLRTLSINKKTLAIEILNQSIINNWQDLYQLKQENNNNIKNGTNKITTIERTANAVAEVISNRRNITDLGNE